MSDERRRRIRSFVRREGRLTPAQRRALETLWPRWGIEFAATPIDLDELFGRRAPRVLEIGFGNGETLAQLAANQPETDYLGIEVHRPGVGRLLNLIDEYGLANVRVFCHDAVEVLQRQIAPQALSAINIFFPDPWPKKRHHKRRLIQPPFLQLLATRLHPGAHLHIATDWENYAEHIRECLHGCEEFELASTSPDAAIAALRPQTKFERRGLKLGHAVYDVVCVRR